MESVPETLERTAKALSTSINAVEKIGGAVSAVADAAEGTPRRSDSLFLKQELAGLIRLHSGLIVGAGIAYARGACLRRHTGWNGGGHSLKANPSSSPTTSTRSR